MDSARHMKENKYECAQSGTGVCCCVWARQTLRFNSPGASTPLPEMTSWPSFWKCDVTEENPTRQPMRICLKNIAVKFHPDPIW